MTKVLFVSSHAELGGSERYLLDLVSHLEDDEVEGVVSLADGPAVDRFRGARFRVEVIPTSGAISSILRSSRVLRRAVASSAADVVHANGVKAALVCVLARLSRPVVWVKHDFAWDGFIARIVASRCARIVGVSKAVLGGLDGPKTRVVMPGIPPADFDQAAGESALQELIGERAPVVALVGRLHPVKGHAALISAGPAIQEKCPDVRFLFVGGRDPIHEAYADEMEQLARTRLGKAAVWVGYRPDLLSLLSACSVAVIVTGSDERAPRAEGFGYVGVEAMAVGTPVVAFANGATPEVLGDCGSLVAPGEEQALAEGVLRVLEEEPARQRAIACGHQRAAESFSMQRFVSEMRDVYVEAAS